MFRSKLPCYVDESFEHVLGSNVRTGEAAQVDNHLGQQLTQHSPEGATAGVNNLKIAGVSWSGSIRPELL